MSSWSDLPRDLLNEIVGCIQKLEDVFAFRAVCKGWLAAGKKEYFKKPWLRQGIPYLMLRVRDDMDDARDFYSLVEGEIVASVRNPKLKVRKCFESLGWLLVIENDSSMCLLDPFSSIEIPLPHQSTFPEYVAGHECDFVRKMVLSARPNETLDFTLVIICGKEGRIHFWRLGDQYWNLSWSLFAYFHDVIYFDGHFYVTNACGYVFVLRLVSDYVLDPVHRSLITRLSDVSTFRCKAIEEDLHEKNVYVLKTSESLLLISKTAYLWGVYEFQVYEFNKSAGTWKEINNLGSMAIFIGPNTTFAIDTCRLFGKIKGNHIYFCDDGWVCYAANHDEEERGKDMGSYNMETGIIESFYLDEEKELLSKECLPVWITPSF